MKIKIKNIKKIFNYLYPTIIIMSQWFSIGGINLSWLLYIITFIFCILKYDSILNNKMIMLLTSISLFSPFITYFFGIASSFNFNLYFSIFTGITCMSYIYSLDEEMFNCFLVGCGIACIIFSTIGLYEILYGNYYFYNGNNYFGLHLNPFGRHYPVVSFPNTNDLSQFLVIFLPCTYLLIKKYNLFKILYIFLSFFVIFNTESKLALISYILIIILSFIIYTGAKANTKLNNIIYAILFLMIICIVDTYTGVLSITIDHFFKINTSADYYLGRYDIYKTLLNLSKSLPLGGFGSSYAIQIISPHNLFLFILCDFGWPSALLFIAILFYFGKKIFILLLNAPNEKKYFYSLLFAVLLLFLIISSISSCNEQRKAIWFFLGICFNITYKSNNINVLLGNNKEKN